MVQSGQLQKQLFKDSAGRLLNKALWREFPHAEHVATDIFRVSMRGVGAAHATMSRFKEYPYKLCELLEVDEHELDVNIACLLSAPLCAVDTFTESFRSQFHSHAQLRSRDARAMLRALFLCLDGSIFSTERIHSANARRVASRRWTHQLRLSQAALGQVGSATPPFAFDLTQSTIAKRKSEDAMLDGAQCCPPPPRKKKEAEDHGVPSCTRLCRRMADRTSRRCRQPTEHSQSRSWTATSNSVSLLPSFTRQVPKPSLPRPARHTTRSGVQEQLPCCRLPWQEPSHDPFPKHLQTRSGRSTSFPGRPPQQVCLSRCLCLALTGNEASVAFIFSLFSKILCCLRKRTPKLQQISSCQGGCVFEESLARA